MEIVPSAFLSHLSPSDPLVVALGPSDSVLIPWLADLSQYKFRIQHCCGLDELLRCLHEMAVRMVVVEFDRAALDIPRLANLILEVAPHVSLVLASGQKTLPTPGTWLARGVQWVFSMESPINDLASVFHHLIQKQEKLRAAEATAKALQIQLQSEGRRTSAIGRTLHEMTHELNTPLAIIQGYCSNILDGITGDITSEQRGNLERIQVACTLMKDVIDRMKKQIPLPESSPDVRRGEARAASRRQIRLPDLAQEVISLMEHLFAAKGVALNLEVIAQCHPVWGNRTRLAQLLVNLLINALRHTPDGGKVTVTLQPETTSGRGLCRLTVRDTGCGIPPENLDKIFLAGWGSSPSQDEERAGLGLAICKEIAAEHSAQLEVESRPGQGASFQLSLLSDPRSRRRHVSVSLVDDIALAGQLLLELRQRSHGPVTVDRPFNMEELAQKIQDAGVPLVLLGALEDGINRALEFLQT